MATPTHEKRLRADSKLAALSQEERAELEEMLLTESCSQADALEWLRGHGVTLSATSLSQYYRTRILPTKWQRMNVAAAELTKVGHAKAKDAARRAITQKVFEMATQPGANVKELTEIYRLMLAGEKTEQDARKLALLEQKAAQADAARAALEQKAAAGGLSEETMELIEEQLRLL